VWRETQSATGGVRPLHPLAHSQRLCNGHSNNVANDGVDTHLAIKQCQAKGSQQAVSSKGEPSSPLEQMAAFKQSQAKGKSAVKERSSAKGV
jgi:hypothetical protein